MFERTQAKLQGERRERVRRGEEFPAWFIVFMMSVVLVVLAGCGCGIWACVELIQWVTSK